MAILRMAHVGLSGGVVEFPVEEALAAVVGHSSPQPMVMTRSDAWTAASVRFFGVAPLAWRSMPIRAWHG